MGAKEMNSRPPQLTNVLLVDDNDRYAAALTTDMESRGASVVRARNASEGVSILRKRASEFDGIVTDISMEGQLSGLRVLRAARPNGFSGALSVASTGLDTRIGYLFNWFALGVLFRCDFLIPKRPIKKEGEIFWLPVWR